MQEMDLVRDIVERVESVGVPYAIGGSIASNSWGIPRLTHDVDIIIVLSQAEVAAISGAFPNPYYVSEAAIRSALGGGMFNIIQTAENFKAALWIPVPDDPFNRSMLTRRQRVEVPPGFLAYLGSPEDVLLHKLLWHKITPSVRQRADAAGIAAVQAGRLDLEYMRSWAARLEITELLEAALAGQWLKAT